MERHSYGSCLQETLQEGGSLTREVLSAGVYDVLLGRGPLQCAAREGNVAALAMLLHAGALDSLDACDGNGLTALQVSLLHPLHTGFTQSPLLMVVRASILQYFLHGGGG